MSVQQMSVQHMAVGSGVVDSVETVVDSLGAVVVSVVVLSVSVVVLSVDVVWLPSHPFARID